MLQNLARNVAVRLFGSIKRLGITSPLFDRTYLALYALYKEYLEAGPIDRLRDFVPRGSIVVDVGANVGFFSRRFATWVGDQGRVILIEPEDKNYQTLVSMLKRQRLFDRVRALKAAAAAAPGKAFLEINPLHPADHKLSRDNTGVAVEVVTLDELVQSKSAGRPSLVKIDVQGAELLVLKGACDILRISGPALFIELHEEGLNRFGTSVSEVLGYLADYGYGPYWLMRQGPHRVADEMEIRAKVSRSGYVDVLFLQTLQRRAVDQAPAHS